jgi:hypothetical protein
MFNCVMERYVYAVWSGISAILMHECLIRKLDFEVVLDLRKRL